MFGAQKPNRCQFFLLNWLKTRQIFRLMKLNLCSGERESVLVSIIKFHLLSRDFFKFPYFFHAIEISQFVYLLSFYGRLYDRPEIKLKSTDNVLNLKTNWIWVLKFWSSKCLCFPTYNSFLQLDSLAKVVSVSKSVSISSLRTVSTS